MNRLLSWLPRGRALPPEVWAARHRGLLLVLAAHLVLLPAFAVSQGWSLAAGWAFDIGPAAFGALACWPRLSRGWRSSMCAMALLSCSALVVVSWHGTIEAHFHYFVMVGALALYEEWWAYLMAIAFVVLQHGVISFWETGAVFDHVRTRVALGRHPRPVRRRAGRRQPDLLARQRVRPRRDRELRGALPARVRRRARWRWRSSRPTGSVLQTNEELRERIGARAPSTSGTSPPPPTARRWRRAGRPSPTARRSSSATCAPTAASAGSSGATR